MKKTIIAIATMAIAATLFAGSMELTPPRNATVRQMELKWMTSRDWGNRFEMQPDGTWKANVRISTVNNKGVELHGFLATTKTSAVFYSEAQVDFDEWRSALTNQPTVELAEQEVIEKWLERIKE